MNRKLLHEPLTHFFLVGGLIFLVYSLLDTDAAFERQIVIDAAVLERLKSGWRLQTNREPTPQELEGLLADYQREELFYREAISLGLEQGDPIVRRRLAQKMTLLVESAAHQDEPDEEELRAWYNARPELYRSEPRIGFKHIYFSHDRPDGHAERDAAALLSRLQGLEADAGQPRLGDSFMLPHEFTDIGRAQLGRLFGEAFAAELFTLETGNWLGPTPSGYGYHLVYLFEVQPARPVPFSESRTRVLQDWQRHRYEQAQKDLLEELKSRYEIRYTEQAQALMNGE